MNKKNLIYVSLISLILILGIYYISIPNNMLENIEPTISESIDNTSTEEISSLVGLRVEQEEMVISKLEDLQNTITDTSKSLEEKNIAYEQLKNLNQLKGKQEEINDSIQYVTGDIVIEIDSDDYFVDNALKMVSDDYEKLL